MDNAIVFFKWTPNICVSYRVSAEPEVVLTSSLAVAQLTIPYNTYVNVSIVATSYRQYTEVVTGLHYGMPDYTLITPVSKITY